MAISDRARSAAIFFGNATQLPCPGGTASVTPSRPTGEKSLSCSTKKVGNGVGDGLSGCFLEVRKTWRRVDLEAVPCTLGGMT
jgi:hypothetical protein